MATTVRASARVLVLCTTQLLGSTHTAGDVITDMGDIECTLIIGIFTSLHFLSFSFACGRISIILGPECVNRDEALPW